MKTFETEIERNSFLLFFQNEKKIAALSPQLEIAIYEFVAQRLWN